MKYVMLIKLAGSSSAMHFFNVNLSKYILKKGINQVEHNYLQNIDYYFF